MKDRVIKMGIVGHGFVGKAVDYGFENRLVEKYFVDPKYNTTIDDLVEWQPSVVFICAPTPMGEDGSIDATIVLDSALKILNHTDAGVIIKSTITPAIVESLLDAVKYSESKLKRIVINPEFLTENNAREQFVNPSFQVVGGHPTACSSVLDLYRTYSQCNKCEFHTMGALEACFVKYAVNGFLATKVTFFNQFYDAVDDAGCNYNVIARAISSDPRIGNTHMKVPGYDMKRGYGGACFPKDIRAFTKFTKRLTLLEKVDIINNQYRIIYEQDDREVLQNVNYGQTKEEHKDQLELDLS
jgi:UDPglucose 6-dehydrogenase